MDPILLDKVSGKNVLLLWNADVQPDNLKNIAEKLNNTASHVQIEHVDRLKMSKHSSSMFDVVLSGVINPTSFTHSAELLSEIARVIKLSGHFYCYEPVVNQSNHKTFKTLEEFLSSLKLAGMVNITKEAENGSGDVTIAKFKAEKPNFEVGSSAQLSFGPKATTDATAVWQLSADDLADDDIIDSDTLLDEIDLKKPAPEDLQSSCGAEPKKRKACKNCTCGLAEEIEQEAVSKSIEQNQPTSSCGSCYLGDAFRCASCPYLGMPAFKPGEKIELSSRQLNVDK